MGSWIVRIVRIVSEVYLCLNPYPSDDPPVLSARESAAALIYCLVGVSPQISEVLRRRRLTSTAVQQLLCLRSWQQSDVITLDTRLIRQAVLPHNGDSDSESDGDDGDVPLCDGEDEFHLHLRDNM
jgi:hypothetical protein